MESDSDQFESADEDFESDQEACEVVKNINEEPPSNNIEAAPDKIEAPPDNIEAPPDNIEPLDNTEPPPDNIKPPTPSPLEIRLEQESASNKINKNTIASHVDTDTVDNAEHVPSVVDVPSDPVTEPSESINKKIEVPRSKTRNVDKPERPQRNREPKSKLGVKLGTKITTDKTQVFQEEPSEDKPDANVEGRLPEGVTACWEDDVGWEPFEDAPKPPPDLYSKNKDVDWGDFEADYMEIPQKCETVHPVLEKLSDTAKDQSSGWSGWGNWGVSSLLSSASLGVTTLTSSVTQGISTVLETGIGVPDPEELAKMHLERERQQIDNPESETVTKSDSIGFGLGNLVSGVTHITKLVETTGTKVLSGGLDTLEVIGKKTMEVLQEGDPGLKKKRALFKIEPDKPVLSQLLREAKEKAEEENRLLEENHFARKAHYETLFDDYHGLVHLEALEMLSKQCDIKLETLIESCTGSALTEMQETMAQIKELCELPDEEDEDSLEMDSLKERLDAAVTDLNVNITYENLLNILSDVDVWLLDATNANDKQMHQKAIETLAELTAIAVEQFHKAGELLLVKERRSTVDEADSLVQLTTTLKALIGTIARKFSERLNTYQGSESVNGMITNIYLEAANSSTYIQDAFHLLLPVLQVGAV